MNSSDFTYKKTKAFMDDTDTDTFDPFEYLEVVPVKDKNIEDDDNLTNPLIVKDFPWNDEFVGAHPILPLYFGSHRLLRSLISAGLTLSVLYTIVLARPDTPIHLP